MKKRVKRVNWNRRRELAKARAEKWAELAMEVFDMAVSRKRFKTYGGHRRQLFQHERDDLIQEGERYLRQLARAEDDVQKAQRNVGRSMRTYQEKLIREQRESEEDDILAGREIDDVMEDGDDESVEWEFGTEYGSPHGHQPVDIQFRVARQDRTPMTKNDAVNVMRDVRKKSGYPPTGYTVTAIDWRNPGKHWTSTDDGWESVDGARRGGLRAVMEEVRNTAKFWKGPWRMGAPKEL